MNAPMRRLIAVLPWVALVAGCGPRAGQPAGAERAATAVTVAPVQRLAVTQWVEVSGTLEPDERVQVAAKVGGRIASVERDLGDRVKGGDVLARLDDTDYQIALRQRRTALAEALAELGLSEPPGAGFDVGGVPRVKAARAQAANAAAKRDRVADLLAKDPSAFSRQDFEDMKTAADVADANAEVAALEARTQVATVESRRADLARAEQDLLETVVRAPAGGDGLGVATRAVSAGDLVAAGATLFTLVKDEPLKFAARVPERYVGQVAGGQRVEVSQDAMKEHVGGVVRRVSPVVEAATRMFTVQIEVPNAERRLKPGSFARGRIAVGEHAGAAFVPTDAVVVFAGVRKVFTVKDGKAVEHMVELGERREGAVEVTAGLEGEERVVVRGASRLTRGAPVTVSDEPVSVSAPSPR